MLRRYNSERGNTLAEMLVYIALVSLLLLVVIQSAVTMSKTSRRSRAYLDVNSAAVAAFSRFSRDIRRATSIDTVHSTLSASAGKLSLNLRELDGSNSTIMFYLSGGQVKIAENGVYTGDITQDNMTISNLTFRKYNVASTTAIRVEMTVAPDASSTVPAINFYSMYMLRGSYIQ